MTGLRIGGLTAFTTVDYPDHLAAVLFCQGCPWRCGYCHNRHLQPFRSAGVTRWSWARVREFLEDRVGILEAVVFSGGEPTAQPGLGLAMREVREMGFKVGLHTAGIFPDRLEAVLGLVDWVGLDIKAPFDARYDLVTGRPGSASSVERSLRLVLASGVPHQLRTTVHPDLLSSRDCARIQADLQQRGAGPSLWQPFRGRPMEAAA
jgi:pyruvate formate lyase activating enzyme